MTSLIKRVLFLPRVIHEMSRGGVQVQCYMASEMCIGLCICIGVCIIKSQKREHGAWGMEHVAWGISQHCCYCGKEIIHD